MDNNADIKENILLKTNYELLHILLEDHTTNSNIIWATNNYRDKGIGFDIKDNIKIENITGYNGNVIKPRVKKSKKEASRRQMKGKRRISS